MCCGNVAINKKFISIYAYIYIYIRIYSYTIIYSYTVNVIVFLM